MARRKHNGFFNEKLGRNSLEAKLDTLMAERARLEGLGEETNKHYDHLVEQAFEMKSKTIDVLAERTQVLKERAYLCEQHAKRVKEIRKQLAAAINVLDEYCMEHDDEMRNMDWIENKLEAYKNEIVGLEQARKDHLANLNVLGPLRRVNTQIEKIARRLANKPGLSNYVSGGQFDVMAFHLARKIEKEPTNESNQDQDQV